KAYNDAQSKMTIVKGRFGSSENFRDSIRDKTAQDDLRDKDRVIQADTRVEELLKKAKTEYESDLTSMNKLNAYVDLLARRERDEDENAAVAVLTDAYQRMKNYSLKVKADDLRIKQGNRNVRRLAAAVQATPTDEAKTRAKQAGAELLKMQLNVYEERSRE